MLACVENPKGMVKTRENGGLRSADDLRMSVGRKSEGPTMTENMTGNMRDLQGLRSKVRTGIFVTKSCGAPRTQTFGAHNRECLRSGMGHRVAGKGTGRGDVAKDSRDHEGENHTRTQHRIRILSGGENERGSRCNIGTPRGTVVRPLHNTFDSWMSLS